MRRDDGGIIRDSAHGYESEDMSLRVVLITTGGLLTFLVATVLLLKPIFGYRTKEHRLLESILRPLSSEYQLSNRFPEPRLQAEPKLDLKALQIKEDAILDHYGWEDRSRGLVRAPITEAMEKVLRTGFPTRENSHGK